MKKAIVTGANGFVGSAVCRRLAEDGVQVLAVVKDENTDISTIEGLSGLRIFCCDMAQFDSMPAIVPERDIDVIYHFAWFGNAGLARADETIQLSNVKAACDLVHACATMGCNRFVFASSIMIYEVMAQMENGIMPNPNTLYSDAKLAADYMAAAISTKLGVEYIRAIISNIYGPGESSPRLINTSLRKLMRGEHCAFSAGEQMYDFIYIDDAAEAFAALGEKGMAGRTYYIGSRQPRPLKEFLVEMRDQVNPQAQIGLGELPFGGVSLTYREFDTDALRRDTGFVPKTTFAQGIRNTINWMRGGE